MFWCRFLLQEEYKKRVKNHCYHCSQVDVKRIFPNQIKSIIFNDNFISFLAQVYSHSIFSSGEWNKSKCAETQTRKIENPRTFNKERFASLLQCLITLFMSYSWAIDWFFGVFLAFYSLTERWWDHRYAFNLFVSPIVYTIIVLSLIFFSLFSLSLCTVCLVLSSSSILISMACEVIHISDGIISWFFKIGVCVCKWELLEKKEKNVCVYLWIESDDEKTLVNSYFTHSQWQNDEIPQRGAKNRSE